MKKVAAWCLVVMGTMTLFSAVVDLVFAFTGAEPPQFTWAKSSMIALANAALLFGCAAIFDEQL